MQLFSEQVVAPSYFVSARERGGGGGGGGGPPPPPPPGSPNLYFKVWIPSRQL